VRSIGRRLEKLEQARYGDLRAAEAEERLRDAELKASADRARELVREGRKPEGKDLVTTLVWITLAGAYEDRVRLNELLERGREFPPGSEEHGRIAEEILDLSSEAVDRAPLPEGQP